MNDPDIRWIQRFSNFSKALGQLRKFIEKGALNELEEQGLIQAFEYTYELAWNTMKDYFESQGETGILGSRDALRLAFKRGLIEDGETWMEMLKSRIRTTHAYDKEVAKKIAAHIVNLYFPEFEKLRCKMEALKEKTP